MRTSSYLRLSAVYNRFLFLSPEDIIEALREATKRGVIIINISQCPRGEVAATYAVRWVLYWSSRAEIAFTVPLPD